MIKIEIKNRLTGSILFEYSKENNTIKDTILEAVKRGADLSGADLSGAYLRDIKILKTTVFTGLYQYIAMPIISEDNKHYIRLGCYTRLLEDWEKDFWNNESEFPNDNGLKSQYRLMAYNVCKEWLKLNS